MDKDLEFEYNAHCVRGALQGFRPLTLERFMVMARLCEFLDKM